MDQTVGSGRIITMPVITEDGEPVEDPHGVSSTDRKEVIMDKEIIQWKLTLHQIGKINVNFLDL